MYYPVSQRVSTCTTTVWALSTERGSEITKLLPVAIINTASKLEGMGYMYYSL